MWFYLALFMAAFVTGIARVCRDREYSSIGNLFSVGVCSGATGFSLVALYLGPGTVISSFDGFYVGIAAVIGLSGKEGDYALRQIVKGTVNKILKLLGQTDGTDQVIPQQSDDTDHSGD